MLTKTLNAAPTNTGKSCCRNCMYVFVVKETPEEYRCALTYYKLPAVERHGRPLKEYPKVADSDVCLDWRLTNKGTEPL